VGDWCWVWGLCAVMREGVCGKCNLWMSWEWERILVWPGCAPIGAVALAPSQSFHPITARNGSAVYKVCTNHRPYRGFRSRTAR
jgi:hypothetical protein